MELNPDGTPKESNPGEDQGSVTLSKAEYDKLVEELAQNKQATTNLVSEIKELREKKQLTDTEKTALENKIKELGDLKNIKPEEITPAKIDSIINERLNATLSAKDTEERNKNRTSALQKFIASNKEFDESNDVGGIKLAALQKKISMFNLDGHKSVEDFYTVFENARLLLKKEEPHKQQTPNPYSNTPSNEGPSPSAEDLSKNLSSVEKKIIASTFGGDEKRYLEQKRKRPDYVETLLRYAR